MSRPARPISSIEEFNRLPDDNLQKISFLYRKKEELGNEDFAQLLNTAFDKKGSSKPQ